jgi:outer membrane protein assembly factor BamE (lipoprotein component of BamABCDE complex)
VTSEKTDRRSRLPLALASVLLVAPIAACGVQVNQHGHVFKDVDLQQIQPGMSKDQVTMALGSPDTTSTIDGEAFYYISTTQKSYAFLKPWEIDRKVVAVYFNGDSSVQEVAQYGLKDGVVVRYSKDETPARGKDLSVIEQVFGNISQRRMFKDARQDNNVIPNIPGPGGSRF